MALHVTKLLSLKPYLTLIGVVLLFFALGYNGAVQKIAQSATYLFHLYAEAESEKLRASGFVNEQGQAEYVVSIFREYVPDANKLFGELSVVEEVRDTLFDDWFVVSLEAGNKRAIDVLSSAYFVDFAVPNRGTWICH